MLFNSIAFLFFFPIVVILYFATPYKYRWILLLAASYYFYMCWRPEYIILIILSTLVDYFVALQMSAIAEKKDRRKWLYLSLFVNLGMLFTFKYFNFFSASVQQGFQYFNIFYNNWVFEALLPVGISFYTFQTLSYTIDVYNNKIEPERNLGYFALYVSFFPQLVAGPIERPGRLLPQFKQNFDFDYKRVVGGLKMMAWGFFLKLVVADRLAPIVNRVFNKPEKHEGFEILLAIFFFAYQIFCDFAGYSIIAIGAAKIMGYDLMTNFRRPYFSTSIREFWQRWHISLSSWFRDYVYIPLGGNRVAKWRWYYNLMITFVVSGIWHGANWTFIIWGFLHGFYLIFALITQPFKDKINNAIGLSKVPALLKASQIVITFILACFAWTFFRANSVGDAFLLLKNATYLESSQLSLNLLTGISPVEIALSFLFIFLVEIIHSIEEWANFSTPFYSQSTIIRWVSYVLIVVLIIGFGKFSASDFIYFQF